MTTINYNNKIFKSLVNEDHGQVTNDTTFYYRQKGNVLWGLYEGGAIEKGTITGKVLESGKLEYYYQHITTSGEMRTGYCQSTPELQTNGCVRLFEKWQWTCGTKATGMSIVEEVVEMG